MYRWLLKSYSRLLPTREQQIRPLAPPTAVLFVCLGNICRSPLAEGVLQMLLDRAGLGDEVGVDSAGTAAYHEGDPPDPRSVAVAEDRGGFTLDGRARRVTPADFEHFDWIFAMDPENLRELEMLKRRHHRKGRLCLLRMFDPEADPDDLTVPDPYYGGPKGFDLIYDQIQRSCEAFIQQELR